MILRQYLICTHVANSIDLTVFCVLLLYRLSSPVILRQYLTWLQRIAVAPPGTPVWPGWLWALGVAAGGMGMTLVHHQFFW